MNEKIKRPRIKVNSKRQGSNLSWQGMSEIFKETDKDVGEFSTEMC